MKDSGGRVWSPGRKRNRATFKSSRIRGTPQPLIKKHGVGSFHPFVRLSSGTQKLTVLLSLPSWGSLFPGTDELAGPWPHQCLSRETSVSRVKVGHGPHRRLLWCRCCRSNRVTSGPQGVHDPALPAGLWASSLGAIGWFQHEMQPVEHRPPPPSATTASVRGGCRPRGDTVIRVIRVCGFLSLFPLPS